MTLAAKRDAEIEAQSKKLDAIEQEQVKDAKRKQAKEAKAAMTLAAKRDAEIEAQKLQQRIEEQDQKRLQSLKNVNAKYRQKHAAQQKRVADQRKVLAATRTPGAAKKVDVKAFVREYGLTNKDIETFEQSKGLFTQAESQLQALTKDKAVQPLQQAINAEKLTLQQLHSALRSVRLTKQAIDAIQLIEEEKTLQALLRSSFTSVEEELASEGMSLTAFQSDSEDEGQAAAEHIALITNLLDPYNNGCECFVSLVLAYPSSCVIFFVRCQGRVVSGSKEFGRTITEAQIPGATLPRSRQQTKY
jgi:hypothetical protein